MFFKINLNNKISISTKINQIFQSNFKRVAFSILVLSLMLFSSSCKKTDSNGFTNKLQFGESVNTSETGWPVVNEKYTFALGQTVNFRIETKDDFGSSDFKLVLKQGGTVVTEFGYPSLQGYGHIYVSSFVAAEDGIYTVEAYVTTGNKLIDTKSLTVTM